MKNLNDAVYGFPTESNMGFAFDEIEALLTEFPNANRDKFNAALVGCTITTVNDKPIVFHSDVHTALKCAIYNRDILPKEWD